MEDQLPLQTKFLIANKLLEQDVNDE